MLFLENKITLINQYLKQDALYDSRFQPGYFINAIAQTAAMQSIEGNDKLQYLPVVYNKQAQEYNYIGLDDTYPIIIYHKHLQTTYVDLELNERKETNKMQMVVFGRLDALNLNAETLGALLVTGFPATIKKNDYSNLPIVINSVTLTDAQPDAQAVFAKEYRNTAYQLGPQHALLQFGYTIESTYNRKCFDICGCLSTEKPGGDNPPNKK